MSAISVSESTKCLEFNVVESSVLVSSVLEVGDHFVRDQCVRIKLVRVNLSKAHHNLPRGGGWALDQPSVDVSSVSDFNVSESIVLMVIFHLLMYSFFNNNVSFFLFGTFFVQPHRF